MKLNAAFGFALLLLIPSLFYRLGFSQFFPVKGKKISLYDNFVWFLFPTCAGLFIVNNILPESFKYVHRIKTDTLLLYFSDFSEIRNSSQEFFSWYAAFLAFSIVWGILVGFIIKCAKKDKGTMIGQGLFSLSWEEVFEKLKEKDVDMLAYLKAKSGDIYRGKINYFSLDSNNKLELIALSDVYRSIYSLKDKTEQSEDPYNSFEIPLDEGVIVFPESSIDNIWYRTSIDYEGEDYEVSEIQNMLNE